MLANTERVNVFDVPVKVLYGEALGCSYIRLIQLVDGLISRYEQAGFKVATDKIHRI